MHQLQWLFNKPSATATRMETGKEESCWCVPEGRQAVTAERFSDRYVWAKKTTVEKKKASLNNEVFQQGLSESAQQLMEQPGTGKREKAEGDCSEK